MSEQKPILIIDANPLLSALRGGKARSVLFSKEFIFFTTEHTTWEVKKYLPKLSAESAVSEGELLYAFDRFPIISIPAILYDDKRPQAVDLIADRDPKDVDVLALALKI